jgi:fructose-bisphosphate aldolase class II
VDLQLLLGEARSIPAFNFNDQFDLAAVVAALEVKGRPGILMISMEAIKYSGLDFLFEIFKFHRRHASQPLFIQLDHCRDEDTLLRAAELDFDAVMADYSHLGLEENIGHVTRITDLLKDRRCLVEAAPTQIANTAGPHEGGPTLTSPDLLRRFAAESGCHLIAPDLGTLHGFGRDKPPINQPRVKELVHSSPVPVAAHGCDFLAPGQLGLLSGAGVRKLRSCCLSGCDR